MEVDDSNGSGGGERGWMWSVMVSGIGGEGHVSGDKYVVGSGGDIGDR